MNAHTTQPLTPRLWRLLAPAMLAISLLRGIRYPNNWSYTHFLFNYDYGFVKRGLIGEIMSHLGSPFFLTYEFFVIFSLGLLICNVLLLALLINDLTRSKNPTLTGGGLLFASSLAVVFLAHTLGYLEHVGLLVTLIALRIRHFYKKLAFLLLAFPLALLVHEGVLILLFPVAFMSLLLQISAEDRARQWAWLGGFSLLIFATTLTISAHTLTPDAAEQMFVTLQADVEQPLRRDAFNVLHRDPQENFQRTMQRFSEGLLQELGQSVLVTAPTILLMVWITVLVLQRTAVPPPFIILAILAAFSPLMMYLWGWDMHRWNTFTITTSFLMLYVAGNASNRPVTLPTFLYFLLALLLFLNAVATIQLFDGYYVKQFPFAEHQQYILDLLRGVVKFPHVPPA